jgi:abhydrolase domain-containing protein 17
MKFDDKKVSHFKDPSQMWPTSPPLEVDAKSKLGDEEPPIPCFYYQYNLHHAKLLLYFHGIGEDIGRL